MELQGNRRPWKEPGTPAAWYCLSGGREAKRVLKSLPEWSLKNTWNSRVLSGCFFCTAFIRFSTVKNVFGPTEQPKSVIATVFEILVSRFSMMACWIISFTESDPSFCRYKEIVNERTNGLSRQKAQKFTSSNMEN